MKKYHPFKIIAFGCIVCLLVLALFFKYADEMVAFKAYLHSRFDRPQSVEPIKNVSPRQFSGDEWVFDATLIAHACGGIDGLSYSNSKEALDLSLEKGLRYVEVDFLFSSDGKLICAHEWDNLGAAAPIDYATFKNAKIFGKYTPLTAEDIFAYMEQNQDLYIVVDTKDNLLDVMKELIALAPSEELLSRLIIQVYAAGEKTGILELYPFSDDQFLLTIYKLGNVSFDTLMQICNDENISVITCPESRFSAEAKAELLRKNFVLYEHTVNRVDFANDCFETGVRGLYTDFLSLDDFSETQISLPSAAK